MVRLANAPVPVKVPPADPAPPATPATPACRKWTLQTHTGPVLLNHKPDGFAQSKLSKKSMPRSQIKAMRPDKRWPSRCWAENNEALIKYFISNFTSALTSNSWSLTFGINQVSISRINKTLRLLNLLGVRTILVESGNLLTSRTLAFEDTFSWSTRFVSPSSVVLSSSCLVWDSWKYLKILEILEKRHVSGK